MDSNFKEILSKPAFDSLEPERKARLLELTERLRGKTGMEAMGVLTEYLRGAQKERPLSKEEQGVMMSAFMEAMPETERVRFQSIVSMMNRSQQQM